MNTLIEQKMKEFEEKFTQEGPLKTYREMRHEYYLNCTDIEAFIRRAMEEVQIQCEVAVDRERIKHDIKCKAHSKDPLIVSICDCGADEHNYAIRQALNAIKRLTNSQPTK